jgi:hypothetical protein
MRLDDIARAEVYIQHRGVAERVQLINGKDINIILVIFLEKQAGVHVKRKLGGR